MDEIAVRVENLGKQYRIGSVRQRHDTLRDALVDALHTATRRLRRDSVSSSAGNTIWALRDVSFDVKRGEVLGIIGRNGAGKSTLLKILSRITEPAAGRVEIRGRVGSLLEVGVGFHPELTGRENIYLNGAVLGMSRAEIGRRFDEIVAFAEIEKFLDTPVKRYSSGMYVRLAFAVAAHLDPDILMVDEVLAVGDAAFQKKCLGKMQDIGSQGRTVLFVSHSMPMIQRLCDRALLFSQGRLIASGKAQDVTRQYLNFGTLCSAERMWPEFENAPGDDVARLRSVKVRDRHGRIADTVDVREEVYLEIEYWNLQNHLRPTAILHFINQDGVCLFATNDWSNVDWWNTPRRPGLVRAICRVPGNFLAEGQVFVLAAINTYNPDVSHALERNVVSFQVIDRSDGDGVRGPYSGGDWPGVLRPMLNWEVTLQANPDLARAEDPSER
jgi:lipopolysaccharide transport system ATP-binding protein